MPFNPTEHEPKVLVDLGNLCLEEHLFGQVGNLLSGARGPRGGREPSRRTSTSILGALSGTKRRQGRREPTAGAGSVAARYRRCRGVSAQARAPVRAIKMLVIRE